MTHREFLKSDTVGAADFRTACRLAGIPATTRQVSKWLRGRGLAITHKAQAAREETEGK